MLQILLRSFLLGILLNASFAIAQHKLTHINDSIIAEVCEQCLTSNNDDDLPHNPTSTVADKSHSYVFIARGTSYISTNATCYSSRAPPEYL